MLSSAALVMASLMFNQSVFISPLNGVSFRFSLFLYGVLIDSCSNKCNLNDGGFLILFCPFYFGFVLHV